MNSKKIDYDALPKWAQEWDFLEIIEAKANKFDIDCYHLIALVKTESNGNHLACRYEPNYRWTFEIESFAEMLKASEATVEMMQSTSFGLAQVMGSLFLELGGALEPIEKYRWPTCMLDKRIGLEYGCRAWKAKTKGLHSPDEMYAAYNGGSVRYDPRSPNHFVNQANVNIFMKNLKEIKKLVRY
jgi:soluble lytic murein transglycosylase-like protein